MARSPSRERSDVVRNTRLILDAAAEVLLANPDGGVGEIAEVAGLSRVTVYRHFATRDALIAALAETTERDVLELLAAERPHRGVPREELAELTRECLSLGPRFRWMLRTLMTQPADEEMTSHPGLARLIALFAEARRAGSVPESLADEWLIVAWGCMMLGAADLVAEGRYTADQVTGMLADTLIRP